jgi:hypothetical protein
VLRGGARPVGQLGHAKEAAGQAGPLRGPCESGEKGREKERLAGLGFQLSFGPLPNRN